MRGQYDRFPEIWTIGRTQGGYQAFGVRGHLPLLSPTKKSLPYQRLLYSQDRPQSSVPRVEPSQNVTPGSSGSGHRPRATLFAFVGGIDVVGKIRDHGSGTKESSASQEVIH